LGIRNWALVRFFQSLLADEIRSIIDTTRTFVLRNFRIRAERARPIGLAIRSVRCEDQSRSHRATDCANVIEALSNASDLRLSHEAAFAPTGRMMIVRTAYKASPTFRPTIGYSYFGKWLRYGASHYKLRAKQGRKDHALKIKKSKDHILPTLYQPICI
jgi:hypothetical protein